MDSWTEDAKSPLGSTSRGFGTSYASSRWRSESAVVHFLLGSSDFYSHWLVSGLRFFGPWGLSLKLLDAES